MRPSDPTGGPPEDRDSTDAAERQLGESGAEPRPPEGPLANPDDPDSTRLFRPGVRFTGLGSGLMARVPTPPPEEVAPSPKVCPHCGAEYETGARFCPNDGASLRPKIGIDPLVGRVLADRYHVLKVVAEGGMGRVYLAEHVRMNRQCAVKVMRPALVEDPDSAARFAREASNAARIIHPNVAAVFDYGESEGLVFLVMEFVEGEPLGEIIQREHVLDPRRALTLTCQVADALIAAHELGIIHRDLKPDNILVTTMKSGKEVAKVVDFGIAKAIVEGNNQQLTGTGLVIGTPEFMAPEQLLGDPADARSDIYALGCIAYLMLTGVPVSDAPTREGMLKRRLHEPAAHPRDANPAVPPELDAIVAKMLEPSPNDRWQSASELKDALEDVRIDGKALTGIARRFTPRSAPTIAFGTPSRPSKPARVQRRRWPALVGAMAGVALLIFGVQYLLQDRQGPRQSPPASIVKSPPAPLVPHPDSVKPTRAATQKPPASSSPAKDADTHAVSTRPAGTSPNGDTGASDLVGTVPRNAAAGIKAPIQRIAQAVESRNIMRLQASWPGLSELQRAYWERNVFALAKTLKASVRYTGATLKPAGAAVDFNLRVRYEYRSGESGWLRPMRLHAEMSRRGTEWQIDRITER